MAASVHRRLLDRTQATGEDFNEMLVRFALERFLYRLARSRHSDSFMLKGATLFAVWEEEPHRATRDIDLLGFGDDSADRLRTVFADVCRTAVPDDGMSFDSASVIVHEIRGGQAYGGKRVRLAARLGNARLSVQIDVGFGDVLARWDAEVALPTLLDFPAPRLRAYPAEAVVAEKLHAMAEHGMLNSRMKDIFDVEALAQRLPFDGQDLTEAVRLTFERRGRPLSGDSERSGDHGWSGDPEWLSDLPAPLTTEFAADPLVLARWRGFLRKNRLEAIELADVVDRLRAFLLEPWEAVGGAETFAKRWPPGGPWE